MNNPLEIMIIAGDPSGDEHASHVVRRLKERIPHVNCFGIGGPAMTAQGFSPLYPFEAFNKMGFAEVIRHLPFFMRVKKDLVATMKKRRPGLLVCVDYPGFNIPLMKAAHALSIPVLWYIVPQVWAWKKKRAAILGKYARHIATVFPFEADYFKGHAAKVTFVGHPLIEHMAAQYFFDKVRAAQTVFDSNYCIAIAPGSRPQEVAGMLKPMVDAFVLLKSKHPQLTASVSRFNGVPEHLYDCAGNIPDITLDEGPLETMLTRCRCAFVTSGTATLITALMQVPMVIAYKTSELTYQICKYFITIDAIGLPNIVAGKHIVPEVIQHDVCPQVLADRMEPYILSKDRYMECVTSLGQLKSRLGGKIASHEVVSIIESLIVA